MDLSNVFLLPAPAGKAAVALAAALLLAGCAVGPDYRTPEVAVPAAWDSADEATPTGAPLLERRWRRLGDPRLDEFIEEAVAGNIDAPTGQASSHEASARYGPAGGGHYPYVAATSSVPPRASGGATDGT